MSNITLDPALRSKLNDLAEPVEVRDEAGAFFGVFLPKDIYRELLRNVRVPFTEAQLEEFRKSGDGRPLSAANGRPNSGDPSTPPTLVTFVWFRIFDERTFAVSVCLCSAF